MPSITGTGIAHPPHVFHQSDVKPFIRDMFADVFGDIDRLLQLFENTQIDTRRFCVPMDWFKESPSFAAKNSLYVEHATKLGIEALTHALEHAGLQLDDISHLFFISTTGLSTPSIDARILNELGTGLHVKRTPIWGLGCGGGAAGLSRAFDYTRANPKEHAAIIAVELCGLTFQRNDLTKSNLVATSLFADGAAAVIVSGDESGKSGPLSIKTTQSTLWPDSLDVMGWDFSSSGFHVIFSRDIPTLVKGNVAEVIRQFSSAHGVTEVDHYIFHPGGSKVLEAYRESLHLPEGKLSAAEKVLRENGNMSSCTVLYVLNEYLQQNLVQPGDSGLISALGPGFSLELLLVEGR